MLNRGWAHQPGFNVQQTDGTAALSRLGTWLRKVRAARGISQESVAHAAELAVSTYSRLERSCAHNQTANPTLETFVRICLVLNVTGDELAELLESTPPSAQRFDSSQGGVGERTGPPHPQLDPVRVLG